MKNIRDEGYVAAEHGATFEDNPYNPGTQPVEHNEWCNGLVDYDCDFILERRRDPEDGLLGFYTTVYFIVILFLFIGVITWATS